MPPNSEEKRAQEATQIAVAIDKGAIDLSSLTSEELDLLSNSLERDSISVRMPDASGEGDIERFSQKPPTGEDVFMQELASPVGDSAIKVASALIGIDNPEAVAEGAAGAMAFRAAQKLLPPGAPKLAGLLIPYLAAGIGGAVTNLVGQEIRTPEEEKDFEQARNTALGVMAGEAIVPVAGTVVRTAGKVGLKAPGFILDKSADLMKKVRGTKTVEEAVSLLADFIDNPKNLSRAFGANPKDINLQRQVTKGVDKNFRSVLKRVRNRGFFKKYNQSFEQIGFGARGEIEDNLLPVMEGFKNEITEKQAKKVPLSFIKHKRAFNKTVKDTTPSGFTKQANRLYNEEIEKLRLLKLNAGEVRDRVASRETIKSVKNTLKGLKANKQNKRGFIALYEDKVEGAALWDEYQDSIKLLREQDKLVDERGFGFDEIYEARQEFFQKSDLDKPPGQLTTSKELLTRMAGEFKDAEARLAKSIDPALAKKLQDTQTAVADLIDIETLAFGAEASLASAQPQKLRLTFGKEAAVVGGLQRGILGRQGELFRFRLAEQLRGAVPRDPAAGVFTSESAAKLLEETTEVLHPLVSNFGAVMAVPTKVAGKSLLTVGNITTDVGKLMKNKEAFLNIIPTVIINAHVVDALKDQNLSGIDPTFIEQASPEEVLPIVEQVESQIEPIAQQEAALAKQAFDTGDAEIIGSYRSELAQKYPVFQQGKEFGEVRVNGERKVYGVAVDIYRTKLQNNSSLDKGQKARMISAVNGEGVIIETPGKTTVRRESIVPEADTKLNEE